MFAPNSHPWRVAILVAGLLLPAMGCGGTRLDRGVVSAPESQAAEVGAEILRRGGNAVDAAIAVQFAICVTNPIGAGLGGGGFVLIYDPAARDDAERVVALDYRETAPSGSHRDMFLDDDGEVDEELSIFSPLASGVPGTVRGMAELHHRFGTLPWPDLIEPAIRLARGGFTIDAWTAGSFDVGDGIFEILPEPFRGYAEFSEYYDGETGATLRLPDLAETLQRIADNGPDEFYEGETARLIVEEMERDDGLIDATDLAGYAAEWRGPVATRFRGFHVVSMPPPSSGGISMIEFLNMIETFEVQPLHSLRQVHLFAEIAKRVFADRAEHLGDPAFHDVPMTMLTDPDYARHRAAEIDLDRRSDPASIAAFPAGTERTGSETTHFSIVDRNGMAVANTTTMNTAFGSGIVVDGAGFLLNSQMNDFSAKPGVPNHYGVTGSTANQIEAGKRPLSSMTPTLVFDSAGDLVLALGSPGGATIVSAVTQVVVHTVDYGMELRQAVDAPRFHHQWPPFPPDQDPLTVETAAPYALQPELLDGLVELGYTILPTATIGDVQAIAVSGRAGTGVFDRRRTGGVAYE